MPSLLDLELEKRNVDIDTDERNFISRALEMGVFNETATIERGHIMEEFRALDTAVEIIVERERTDTDAGNLFPTTIEGQMNENGWLRTYAPIENAMLALLRFYDREVDAERRPNRQHSFHANVLRAFQND
ncbi:MAG: hypothetical protein LQ343_006666 [Gyalolechia ehrenbergii]|nr:MAG: hypothetical protein LQ343_006666 [Gyalolechia ehrenbergii]